MISRCSRLFFFFYVLHSKIKKTFRTVWLVYLSFGGSERGESGKSVVVVVSDVDELAKASHTRQCWSIIECFPTTFCPLFYRLPPPNIAYLLLWSL